MKGSKGATGVVSMAVPLVVFLVLGTRLPLALGPALDIVKVLGREPEAGQEGEPKGPEEESECELG